MRLLTLSEEESGALCDGADNTWSRLWVHSLLVRYLFSGKFVCVLCKMGSRILREGLFIQVGKREVFKTMCPVASIQVGDRLYYGL